MTKHIVEYKMHTDGINKTIPYFIEDGGYFEIGNKKIGVTCDDSEVYIPLETLTEMSSQAIIDRVVGMDIIRQGETLTESEKEDIATEWLTTRGF